MHQPYNMLSVLDIISVFILSKKRFAKGSIDETRIHCLMSNSGLSVPGDTLL